VVEREIICESFQQLLYQILLRRKHLLHSEARPKEMMWGFYDVQERTVVLVKLYKISEYFTGNNDNADDELMRLCLITISGKDFLIHTYGTPEFMEANLPLNQRRP